MSDLKGPLEKELKYFLAKKDYEKLLKASKKNTLRTVSQINFYFDNKSLELRKNRVGLRIRIENKTKCTLTVKEPSSLKSKKVPSLKIRKEWEARLSLSKAKAIISGKYSIFSLKSKPVQVLRKYIAKNQYDEVISLGSVENLRTFVKAENKTLLEIDKFKMFKNKFYELEVETQKPFETDRMVRSLLKKHSIAYRPMTKSKLARFLELWKKQKRH